jgi:hypothetical protein
MALSFKTLPRAAARAAALGTAACAPAAGTRRAAVADGVKFEYGLKPVADAKAAHTYHVDLTLTDAETGAQVPHATVALNLFGPGEPGALVNLTEASAGAYGGEVSLPQAATYNLTFQVNRAPAPSAQVLFAAERPSGD